MRRTATAENMVGCGSGAHCGAPPTHPSPPGTDRWSEQPVDGVEVAAHPNVIRHPFRIHEGSGIHKWALGSTITDAPAPPGEVPDDEDRET